MQKFNLNSSFWLKKCVDASPLVVANNSHSRIFIGSHSGIFCCVENNSGNTTEIWRILLPHRIEASASITQEGILLVSCYDGNLYFIDSNDGTIISTYSTNEDNQIRCQSLVFYNENNCYVAFGDYNSTLHLIDLNLYLKKFENFKLKTRSSLKLNLNGSIAARPLLIQHQKQMYIIFIFLY